MAMTVAAPYVADAISRFPRRTPRILIGLWFLLQFAAPFSGSAGSLLWLEAVDVVIAYLFWMAIRNRGASFRGDASRIRRDYSLRLAVFGVVAQILMVGSSFSYIYKGHHFLTLVPFVEDPTSHTVINLLVAIGTFTVVPVCEELLFRGLLASNSGFRHGKWGMLAYAALSFAMLHVSQNFWPTFLSATVWALILRHTKNITISISLHATWNFLCSLPFLLGFVLPHFDGWNGLVNAPVYSSVHAVCRVVGFSMYAVLIFYLARSSNRWSTRSRRRSTSPSSRPRERELVAA